LLPNGSVIPQNPETYTAYFPTNSLFSPCFHEPNTAVIRSGERVLHDRYENKPTSSGIHMRRQVVTDMRVPNSVWKKKVSDTLYELNIIPDNFSGKVVISFKEGGVSYIEKTETFK